MDGILGVGPIEIIVIVVLALIFLGPERLPGTIREVAKFLKQMRAIGNELTSQFSEELKALDDFNPKKILAEVIDLDDDELNLKDSVGITKEDLTLDVDKAVKGNLAAKPAANAKPKIKENDDDNAIEGVTTQQERDNNHKHAEQSSELNREKVESSENTNDDVEQSDGALPPDPDMLNEDSPPSSEELDNASQPDIAESEEENRIVPPSMNKAQELLAGETYSPPQPEGELPATNTGSEPTDTETSPEQEEIDVESNDLANVANNALK